MGNNHTTSALYYRNAKQFAKKDKQALTIHLID